MYSTPHHRCCCYFRYCIRYSHSHSHSHSQSHSHMCVPECVPYTRHHLTTIVLIKPHSSNSTLVPPPTHTLRQRPHLPPFPLTLYSGSSSSDGSSSSSDSNSGGSGICSSSSDALLAALPLRVRAEAGDDTQLLRWGWRGGGTSCRCSPPAHHPRTGKVDRVSMCVCACVHVHVPLMDM